MDHFTDKDEIEFGKKILGALNSIEKSLDRGEKAVEAIREIGDMLLKIEDPELAMQSDEFFNKLHMIVEEFA